MRNTLRKSERLSNNILITELLREGHSWFEFPFKVNWILAETSGGDSLSVLFSVPRSLFKKAVDRNTIRRRMREGFRLHRNLISDMAVPQGHVMLIGYRYSSREILSSSIIHQKIIVTLKRLKGSHEEPSG